MAQIASLNMPKVLAHPVVERPTSDNNTSDNKKKHSPFGIKFFVTEI